MATNHEYNKRQRRDALPRARQIARMRRDGWNWTEIATFFGVTRQRVQQLYAMVKK